MTETSAAVRTTFGEEGVAMRDSMPFHRLASVLAAIEEEPSRMGKESLMRAVLADAWGAGESRVLACVALTTMQLEPSAKPVKLGMGSAQLLSAIARAGSDAAEDAPSKETIARLKLDLKRLGDIGTLAAAELAASRGGAASGTGTGTSGDAGGGAGGGVPMDVLEVLQALRELHSDVGGGSHSRKPEALAALLSRLSPLEAKMARGSLTIQ